MVNETSNRAYIINDGNQFEICMPDLSFVRPRFSSEEEFAEFVADWPGSRLIELWNHFPGVVPVKKFTDRKTAIRRIWAEIEESNRPHSKAEAILRLVRQRGGATIEALMAATGWQAHSVRGFISGHIGRKLRLNVKSFKRDGHRVYSIASS